VSKSHKLDPQPLDEGPRSKSGKSRLNLQGTIWTENELVWIKFFKKISKENTCFVEQDAS